MPRKRKVVYTHVALVYASAPPTVILLPLAVPSSYEDAILAAQAAGYTPNHSENRYLLPLTEGRILAPAKGVTG